MHNALHGLALALLFFSASLRADLVILQYHHISADTPAATSTSPRLFQQQLDRIAELGLEVVGLEEGTEQALMPREQAPQQVALTFDDAYESVYTTAWPILRERRLPFTVFVNTDAIDSNSKGYMNWEQLRELAGSGLVSIGNHTSDHRHLIPTPAESRESLRARVDAALTAADSAIERHLGISTRLFAYPYGEYSTTAQELIRGRRWLAYGQHSGPVGACSDPTAMPRFPASNSYGSLQALSDKLQSKAMPIDKAAMPGAIIATNPPRWRLALPENWDAGQLSCFAQGEGRIAVEVLPGNTAEVQSKYPFESRRSRYNCTYPQPSGNYYWLSQPWVNPVKPENQPQLTR